MDSTKVFVDSIKAVVSYSSEVPTSIQECQTNWLDVAIVAIICFSVIAIVAICVFGYKCIKKQESESLLASDKEKRKSEKEAKEYKQSTEILDREYRRQIEVEDREYKHKIELEDREYKRNQDLITKKLHFLNELCYELKNTREVCDGKESEKNTKVLKGFDSDEIKLYKSELNKALGISENNSEMSNNGNKVKSETI